MTPEAIAEITQAMRVWREAHPQAAFDEIETEVQRQWAPVQAQLVAEAIEQGTVAQPAEDTRPSCPRCARPMQTCLHNRSRSRSQPA